MIEDRTMTGIDIHESESLGVGSSAVTRRDFVGNTLKAAGAGALLAAVPGIGSRAHAQGLGDEWTGAGGVGDYALANGNTATVVNAAHRVRDGGYDGGAPSFEDTKEIYDLVVVGGGVAGLTAAYTLYKNHGGAKRCLLLENHAMFGGESRGNQVELDGHLLTGPQGANQSSNVTAGEVGEFQREIGLPEKFDFAEAEGLARPLRIGDDHYDALFSRQKLYDKGWYLGFEHGWFRNPDWENGFAPLPWPADFKAKLAACSTTRRIMRPKDWPAARTTRATSSSARTRPRTPRSDAGSTP